MKETTESIDEAFESALFLVNWANEEMLRLDNAISDFLKSDPYKLVFQLNAHSGQKELKMMGAADLPNCIRGTAAGIIKHLRDALDQASYAANSWVSGSGKRQTHFPFGESPDDLENSLSLRKAAQCKDISPLLYDVYRRCEPYQTGNGYSGGNNALRLLGRVSGPHKHRITLAPEPVPNSLQGGEYSFGTGGGCIGFGKWNRKKGEAIILATGKDGYIKGKLNVSVHIVFENTILARIPVDTFLKTCAHYVAKIVDDLKTEAIRIGQPSSS